MLHVDVIKTYDLSFIFVFLQHLKYFNMAAGFWNKVKNLFTKTWSGMKKGAKWLNDNIVKPIVKPALQVVAPAIPYGDTIKKFVDGGSKVADNLTSKNPNVGDIFKDLHKTFGGLGPNRRISLKN